MKFGAKEILTLGLAAFCLFRSADTFSTLRVSPVTGQATAPTTTGPGQFGYDECRPNDKYDDRCNMCVCNARGRWICTARDCDSTGPADKQETEGDGATFEEFGIQTTPETRPIQTTQATGDAEPESEETGVSGSPVPESTDENLPTEAPGLFVRVTPIPASEMCKTNEDNMKTYFDGCNTCRCIDIGQSVCTKKACPVILVTSRPSTHPTTAAPEVEQPKTHDTPEELGLQDWFPTTAASEPVQPRTHDTPEELGIQSTFKTETTAVPGQFVRVTPIPASEMCKTNEDTMKTYFDGCNTCRCFDIGQSVCTKKACPVILVTSIPSTHPTTAAPEVEQPKTHDTPEELGLQDWFPTTAASEPVQPRTHDTTEELGIRTTPRPETQPTTVTSESGEEPETTAISETSEKDEVSQSEDQVEQGGESEGISESPDDAHAVSQSEEQADKKVRARGSRDRPVMHMQYLSRMSRQNHWVTA